MPKQSSLFPADEDYAAFLNNLKGHIRKAQVKAALTVNQELILLYCRAPRDRPRNDDF